MIRFNGFPFLEKEDHAYNVSGMWSHDSHCTASEMSGPVSTVMRTELHTLSDSDMCVKDVGA